MRHNRAVGLSVLIGVFLAAQSISGCGYSLVGTGQSVLPSHITSVAVPMFSNQTLEPELEKDITSAVRQAFIRDGRLKVAASGATTSILEGRLESYTLEPVAFDISDRVTQYRVIIGVHIKFKDLVEDKVLLEQDFSAREEFRVTSAITSREAAKVESRKVAAEELAGQLVNLILEGF